MVTSSIEDVLKATEEINIQKEYIILVYGRETPIGVGVHYTDDLSIKASEIFFNYHSAVEFIKTFKE